MCQKWDSGNYLNISHQLVSHFIVHYLDWSTSTLFKVFHLTGHIVFIQQ